MKASAILITGILTISNTHALSGFSGKPFFQGKVKEIYYSATPNCSYLAFEAENAADKTVVRIAYPISGGSWVGQGFTTEGDANRYWALLLSAKTTGSDIRAKLMDENLHKWNRCGDGTDYYLPEYILLP